MKVLLTAKDRYGVMSIAAVVILPKTKTIYLSTDPPGFELTLDGFDIRTNEEEPFEVVTWVNHNLVIDVDDQSG